MSIMPALRSIAELLDLLGLDRDCAATVLHRHDEQDHIQTLVLVHDPARGHALGEVVDSCRDEDARWHTWAHLAAVDNYGGMPTLGIPELSWSHISWRHHRTQWWPDLAAIVTDPLMHTDHPHYTARVLDHLERVAPEQVEPVETLLALLDAPFARRVAADRRGEQQERPNRFVPLLEPIVL